VTRLRALAKAAEGTTKVKSYYYFLIGLLGIGYGLRLAPGLASPEATRSEHKVVLRETDPRFWRECRQSRNEMHWVEAHLRGAIAVGRFQGIENLAG